MSFNLNTMNEIPLAIDSYCDKCERDQARECMASVLRLHDNGNKSFVIKLCASEKFGKFVDYKNSLI